MLFFRNFVDILIRTFYLKFDGLKQGKIPLKFESVLKEHLIPLMKGKKEPKPLLGDGERILQLIGQNPNLNTKETFQKVNDDIIASKRRSLGREAAFVTTRDLFEFW